MAYIGNSPGVASQRVVTNITATAGQTVFTPISGYTLGYVDVYQNGLLLVSGTDYTADDGQEITFAQGANLDDDIQIVAYQPRGLTDGYTKAEADARYEPLDSAYTKAESDSRYATTSYVDTAESDAVATANAYTDTAVGNVITDLVGDTTPQLGGNLDTNGNDITFGDNDKANFGASNDLQIYHDGSHSVIKDAGTGYLKIGLSDQGTAIQNTAGNNILVTDATDVSLRHDGSEKLATTNTGIDVTGTITTDGLTSDGNADVSGTITQDANLLRAIDTSIADTAVDVFIYDTRKDSDGGAWRKRTQNTSWYNETLNTATRGSRREFPAVAVIVAESDTVTIYDGDDPDLPMWMGFPNQDNTENMIAYNTNLGSCKMLNGVLCVGIQFSGGGLTRINFISEESYRHRETDSYPLSGAGGLTIADRVGPYLYNPSSVGNIVNSVVNDVAMTVLPNALIDSATGLPIPTIAVATNGGVSVIKDDGTVVDFTATYNSNNQYNHISFLKDNRIISVSRSGQNYPTIFSIPSSDRSSFTSDDIIFSPNTTDSSSGSDIHTKNFTAFTSTSSYGEDVAMGGGGLRIANIDDVSGDDTALVADIRSDYNTGWMNGDIKLATLSDTDDTDVTGSELVTNGTFDTDTDWTKQTGWTISGGVASCNGASSYIYQTTGIPPNTSVTLSFEITSYTSGSVRPGSTGFSSSLNFSSVGTHSITYTTAANDPAGVELFSSSFVGSVDNVSVRLAEEDRSVNNNGLQVFGTVTKNSVATGADLVAYTDFVDNTRYLFQPPNSGMDFGTGDFSVMLWHYHSDATLNDTIYFVSGQSTGNTWQVGAAGSDQSYLWVIGGSINARSASSTVIHQAWTHLTYVRRNGVTEIWRNGALIETDTDTTDVDSNEGIQIPAKTSCGDGNDSLALLRISATAPSPEQIAKIYEDEKVLFQENAQATLYGSSDSVTALAYDDSTDLLHAGTSAGRSVFQGLRRVDNTTDAVGSAISASNGMVADD